MIKKLLTNEQTHPVVLLHIMLQKYGHDCLQWPPSVVKASVENDFGVRMAAVNVHKFLAAGVVATRDEFWTEWEHFHFLCQALDGSMPNSEEVHEHSVGQMMVAVDIANHIRESLKSLTAHPPFSEEVARYVAAQALNSGVWFLPPPLSFAAHFAAKKWYKCRDCGEESEVVFDDGICDYCTMRFDTDRLGSWRPNPHLLKKGWGKNIEIFEKNPTKKVKAKFEKLLGNSDTLLSEGQTDICAARAYAATGHMESRRKELRMGLEILNG